MNLNKLQAASSSPVLAGVMAAKHLERASGIKTDPFLGTVKSSTFSLKSPVVKIE